MNETLLLKQDDLIVGAVLKSEVVSIAAATDNEWMIYIHLRNGTRVELYHGPDEDAFESIMLGLISDMGWV